MPGLTLDCALLQQHGIPAPLDVMNGSKRAGNSTEMGFEEIISAEFLVSLRTSTQSLVLLLLKGHSVAVLSLTEYK